MIKSYGAIPVGELLSATREAMGKDFMIEIRVSGSEHLSGGLGLEDAIKYCKILQTV